jgi:ketosteroid isomerase-like protein
MSPTRQRQTADALLAAFNAMDVPAILALRSPTCIRQIRPASANVSNQNNDAFAQHLHSMLKILQNFELTCYEFVEDVAARKIVMWLRARADTIVGEYVSEYMWTLEFDEAGKKIVWQKEYVDSAVMRDFWPKVRESVKKAGE